MPRRNREADKQGQISRLQGDKTQQKPFWEIHRSPGAGVRGHPEGAFFGSEETVPLGQKGGCQAADGGAVVAGTDMRLDEAQGHGMGVARDHIQARPRGQGQWRQPLQTLAAQGETPAKTCGEIHPDTQPCGNRGTAGDSGQTRAFRRLGDGHHRRQERHRRHCRAHRTAYPLYDDGPFTQGEKRGICGRHRHRPAAALQVRGAHHHHRQRNGIRRA